MAKWTNNDLQNTTQEIKKNEHNEPHKKRGELCYHSCIDGTIFIISLIYF
jgi:hypothetical protein